MKRLLGHLSQSVIRTLVAGARTPADMDGDLVATRLLTPAPEPPYLLAVLGMWPCTDQSPCDRRCGS